jgi:hypothetical protein
MKVEEPKGPARVTDALLGECRIRTAFGYFRHLSRCCCRGRFRDANYKISNKRSLLPEETGQVSQPKALYPKVIALAVRISGAVHVRRAIRLCWVSRMEHGPQAQLTEISLLYPIARGNCPLTIPTSYDWLWKPAQINTLASLTASGCDVTPCIGPESPAAHLLSGLGFINTPTE